MPDFRNKLQMNKYEILGFVPEKKATVSAPSAPVDGQAYFDITLNVMRQRITSNWVNFIMDGDTRLTDARTPLAHGHSQGDITGLAAALAALVPTSRQVSSGTGLTGGGDLSTDRTLSVVYGSSAGTAAQGNDTRLSDSRNPNGAAGGDLTGTYPNPTVANGAVTLAKLAAAIKTAAAGGSAAVGDAALRAIGTGAADAMAGNTRLDTIAAPTGPVSAGSQRITNLSPSSAGTDAVNRNELDAARQGFAGAKDPVRVRVTTNVNLAAPGATLDGVTMAVDDRFLTTAQSTGTQNGIYVWNGAAVPATRAGDADATGEVKDGTTVAVAEGTDPNSIYIQNTTPSGAPGSWTESWTKYTGGAVAYTAGAGLDLTGVDFSVKVDNASLEINADVLRVKALGILNSMIADGTINLTTKVTGVLPVANGGTGGNTPATARAALSAAGSFYVTSPALTADTWSANINHGLGVNYPSVNIYEISSGELVDLDVKNIDANNIQIRAGGAAIAGVYGVRVVG